MEDTKLATPPARRLDDITLTILQSRLDVICDEMGIVLGRAAQSPIFAESHDYSCFLTGADGYMVSFADGIPLHTGSGGFAVRRCIEYWDGVVAPGDVYIQNDPYFAMGNHLPDWTVTLPVFSGETLLGFTCARAHQIDIGGGYMGSYNSDAREIFEEGIRLPPLKLFDAGERRHDVWDLLMLNTRMPETVSGDLSAMIGACRIGALRLSELAEDFGARMLGDAFSALLDHSAQVMRSHIEKIPDGTYSAVEVMNNNVLERVDVPIKVTITIRGSEVVVDFSGSGEQLPGFKNSPYVNTCAATYLALRTMIDPNAPMNEGAYRMITVTAPEGTLVNPTPPTPVGFATTHPGQEIVHACWRALGEAVPEEALAGWAREAFPLSSGQDDRGRRYAMYHWGAMGAAGATSRRDGLNQIGVLVAMGSLFVPSLELYEQRYPVEFLAHEFRTDGGGPGQRRGGTGVHYEVRVTRPARWSFRCEGLYTPSGFGARGGEYGREAILEMTDLESGAKITTPQYGLRDYPPVLLTLDAGGGGGWGDPADRDPEEVRADVLDGLVSVARARERYGVALEGPDRMIDAEATARLRRKLVDARAGRRM